MRFTLTFAHFSPVLVGLFSRSRLRGTQVTCLYTSTQVWVPGRVRGACSVRSKYRNLASNCGVDLGGATAEQNIAKPPCQLYCFATVKAPYRELFYSTAAQALYFVAATIQQQSHVKLVWTSTSVHGPGIGVSVPCVL